MASYNSVDPLDNPLDNIIRDEGSINSTTKLPYEQTSTSQNSMSHSQIFSQYESQFGDLLQQIKLYIAKLQNEKITKSEFDTSCASMEKYFSKCSKTVKSMELEAHSLGYSEETGLSNEKQKRAMLEKVKSLKASLFRARQNADEIKLLSVFSNRKSTSGNTKNGANDNGGGGEEEEDDDDDKNQDIQDMVGGTRNKAHRQRARESTKLLKKGTKSLNNSLTIIESTHELGKSTLQELGKQGDTIKGSTKKLQNVNQELGTSRKILTRMEMRKMTTNIVLSCIIVVLVIVILCLIYFGFIHPIVSMFRKRE